MNESQITPGDFAELCGDCFERLTQRNVSSESLAVDRIRNLEPGLDADCPVCRQAVQRWSPVLKHFQLADQQLHATAQTLTHAETRGVKPLSAMAPWLTGEPIERADCESLPAAILIEPPTLPNPSMAVRDTSRPGFWLSSSLVALVGILAMLGLVFEAGRRAESRATVADSASSLAIAEFLRFKPIAEGQPSEAGVNRLVALGLPSDCRPGNQQRNSTEPRADVSLSELSGESEAEHVRLLMSGGFVCCTQCHRSELPGTGTPQTQPNALGGQVARNCAVCHQTISAVTPANQGLCQSAPLNDFNAAPLLACSLSSIGL